MKGTKVIKALGANGSHYMDDDDQDWALCDKDCGWCGHCADGVDY
jgi:hypothetical protein